MQKTGLAIKKKLILYDTIQFTIQLLLRERILHCIWILNFLSVHVLAKKTTNSNLMLVKNDSFPCVSEMFYRGASFSSERKEWKDRIADPG